MPGWDQYYQPIILAASPAADLLVVNGRIYTQNPEQAWVEAIAIRDGKIEAVGSTEQLQSRREDKTQLIDLGGKMAMPGINEAHSHPVWGGLKHLFQCNFPFTVTPDVLANTLKACVARNETLWIQEANGTVISSRLTKLLRRAHGWMPSLATRLLC